MFSTRNMDMGFYAPTRNISSRVLGIMFCIGACRFLLASLSVKVYLQGVTGIDFGRFTGDPSGVAAGALGLGCRLEGSTQWL